MSKIAISVDFNNITLKNSTLLKIFVKLYVY